MTGRENYRRLTLSLSRFAGSGQIGLIAATREVAVAAIKLRRSFIADFSLLAAATDELSPAEQRGAGGGLKDSRDERVDAVDARLSIHSSGHAFPREAGQASVPNATGKTTASAAEGFVNSLRG